jgi:hypothetical protein
MSAKGKVYADVFDTNGTSIGLTIVSTRDIQLDSVGLPSPLSSQQPFFTLCPTCLKPFARQSPVHHQINVSLPQKSDSIILANSVLVCGREWWLL